MTAASPPPPEAMNPKPENMESDNPQVPVSQDTSPHPLVDPQPSVSPTPVTSSADPAPSAAETANPTTDSVPAAASTPSAPAVVTPPPQPVAPSFTPSFRPLAPQFSPVTPNPAFPNPAFAPQNPSVQPPGVTPPPVSIPPPGAVSGAGSVTVSVSPVPPPGVYYPHATAQPHSVAPVPYWQPPPNGYMTIPAPSTHTPGLIPPPGIPRYPAPYPGVARPLFPPRPPATVGVVPTISRPPVPVSGAPIMPPMLRPVVPIVPPTEKPQTTVYVGKIASTVDNEFIKSLLGLCGPVKSWKRPSDGNGTPRGFGFCEFESAEGVLRALRLLSKLNVDGQELVLNVNQATREYLERYIAKKTEREKHKETGDDAVGRETGVSDAEKQEPTKTDSKKDAADVDEKKKDEDPQTFGLVTDEDRNSDKEALEKVKQMIEERLKTNPLPPPPPTSTNVDGSAVLTSELANKSKNGEADADGLKNADEKIDDDISGEHKISSENDKAEGVSSDRSRRRGRSRERDRDSEIKREKERELERYERDRDRERLRRERERDHKIREAERLYKDRLKEWEAREREKEHQRLYEKEREKERESKRRREISFQEDESDDDDSRKRRHRGGVLEEKRRRRQREKEDDLADRRREEDEIAEARKRAMEEDKQKLESGPAVQPINGFTESEMQREIMHIDSDDAREQDDSELAGETVTSVINDNLGDAVSNADESTNTVVSTLEVKRNGSVPSRKLGFGLIGSGKKTTVPSVFHEEDDDSNKDKKMRPLVPIDYSTEELQAVQRTTSGNSPNLVAAAEFAKRISGGSVKEEKSQVDKDRRRSSDRHRVRNEDDNRHTREEGREVAYDRISEQREREKDDKPKMTDNKKLLDAKQLIDMIPKTKEELFSYDINWAVYDKHELHERMRPWISKKITEFLGEEEPSLVDYIVSSTNSHVQASEMLDLLQSILDEEAEMFVLKMWRMLIFEIKKVEKGLSSKLKA